MWDANYWKFFLQETNENDDGDDGGQLDILEDRPGALFGCVVIALVFCIKKCIKKKPNADKGKEQDSG